MINHITRVADISKSEQSIPYGFFLSDVTTHLGAHVKKWKSANMLDKIWEDEADEEFVHEGGSSTTTKIIKHQQQVLALQQQMEIQAIYISRMKTLN